ncbi:SET domain-containing protein [Podospora aff. communis PSN243]|uniref:SET domain-containing protein n=1 Tax=Podospora aff. communis PSN243 TaxID=3040156 RepID=A0AAV9G145_9PEZI|nr:SET domain-containing protein [Podospora aff. communis PSN243]
MESRLFTIDNAPGAGRGVFATRDIPANTHILTAADLTVHVLFREYRGEVCSQCFSYALGGKQPLKSPAHNLFFCSTPCQETFHLNSDPVSMTARAAVENLIKTKPTSDQHASTLLGPRPTPAEISLAWDAAETQANLIRTARSPDAAKIKPKSHARAVQRALSTPVSPDVLTFLFSAVLAFYTTPSTPSSENPYSEGKQTLLSSLESESTPYLSTHELAEYTSSYLHLLAVLPADILPFVSGEKLHEMKSRETHNSFGIRSLFDGGSEFFGYGVWPSASYFNHSCDPNLVRRREGREWVFSAGREIHRGEQLYISYVNGGKEELRDEKGEVMGWEERGRLLKKTWGFECACGRCADERVKAQVL